MSNRKIKRLIEHCPGRFLSIKYLLIGENCFWVDSIKLFNLSVNKLHLRVRQRQKEFTIKPCMELDVRLIISIMHQLFRSHNVIMCLIWANNTRTGRHNGNSAWYLVYSIVFVLISFKCFLFMVNLIKICTYGMRLNLSY